MQTMNNQKEILSWFDGLAWDEKMLLLLSIEIFMEGERKW